MSITITAFANSPDHGLGLARDTRVRWALAEVGQPYDVRLVSFKQLKEPAHLALNPFGSIPTLEEGDLSLFETGAIVLHLAERHAGLLPNDADARSRAIAWMFAAVSSIEPWIIELDNAELVENNFLWSAEHHGLVKDRLRGRLKLLSRGLGEAPWLDGAFSAGDLMMADVLRRLKWARAARGIPKSSGLCCPRGSATCFQARLWGAARDLQRQPETGVTHALYVEFPPCFESAAFACLQIIS